LIGAFALTPKKAWAGLPSAIPGILLGAAVPIYRAAKALFEVDTRLIAESGSGSGDIGEGVLNIAATLGPKFGLA
jgi:hypothetical protein